MKRIMIILFVSFLLFTGCSKGEKAAEAKKDSGTVSSRQSQQNQTPFHSLSPAEAMRLIQGRNGLVVIDVRTPPELREGAIEGSILIPFWTVMQGKLTIPKTTPVMLVCAIGGRSYAAAQMLVRFGYKEVYGLSGGISAWKEAGLPLKYPAVASRNQQ